MTEQLREKIAFIIEHETSGDFPESYLAIADQKARGGLTKTGKTPKNHFETGEELFQWWIKRD